MSIQPLPGPDGLFSVSARPRFLRGSGPVGWRGVFFTSIVGAPTGSVDQGHQRFCLIRSLQPLEVRTLPHAPWESVPACTALWQPGDEQRSDWRQGGPAQFLFIDAEHAEQVLDGAGRRLVGTSGRPTNSRTAELILDAMDADLAQSSPAGPLVGEGLASALIAHLAGVSHRPQGKLYRTARERVVAHIESHLARAMTLTELAGVAGVGLRQFNRMFRASVGESPHQFVLRRRVERAKDLIARGVPLSQVALQCGFVDQSQFTRAFGRQAGVTPGRYRAALLR